MRATITALIAVARQFFADQRGAAGAEFAIMLPLPIAVTLLAAEYGNGLMTRDALDLALRDATRLLSRAPLAVEDQGGVEVPVFHDAFVERARTMIAERTGVAPEAVTFGATLTQIADAEGFRTEVILIETEAQLEADLSLLAYIARQVEYAAGTPGAVSKTLTMSGYDRARYVGESPLGAHACAVAARNVGSCGGPR